jgi:hypothetical protein
MARLRIKTRRDFLEALRRIPAGREANLDMYDIDDPDREGAEYGLWHALLRLIHERIDARDWEGFRTLAEIFDGVERVGKRSEMWETNWVAFIEDLCLPETPKDR